jgi:hypothetical protein
MFILVVTFYCWERLLRPLIFYREVPRVGLLDVEMKKCTERLRLTGFIYRIRATAGIGGSCGLGELALLAVPRTQCSFVRACSTHSPDPHLCPGPVQLPTKPRRRALQTQPPPRAFARASRVRSRWTKTQTEHPRLASTFSRPPLLRVTSLEVHHLISGSCPRQDPRRSRDGRELPTPRRQTPVGTSTSTCPRVGTVRVVERVVNGRSGALNPR